MNLEAIISHADKLRSALIVSLPEILTDYNIIVEKDEKTSVLRLERKEEIPEPESIKRIYHHSFQIVLA